MSSPTEELVVSKRQGSDKKKHKSTISSSKKTHTEKKSKSRKYETRSNSSSSSNKPLNAADKLALRQGSMDLSGGMPAVAEQGFSLFSLDENLINESYKYRKMDAWTDEEAEKAMELYSILDSDQLQNEATEQSIMM